MIITLYDEDGLPVETKVPHIWEICYGCRGNGSNSSHLEPDGGGFTQSEFAEAFEGPEEQGEYWAGSYDRPCEICSSSGKIQIPDLSRLPKKERERYKERLNDDARFEAEEAAERKIGC